MEKVKSCAFISVIIPVYNVSGYLERCIESVRKQTYANLEIILVDDGSTDKSGTICDSYISVDNRIKVVHKKNGGLSSARNAAIDVMTGEYMVCVDSDDYISNDYIEYLYNLLIDNDVDISMCQCKKVYSERDSLDIVTSNVEVLDSEAAIKYFLYQKKFTASAPCKLYKSCLFNSLRYPDGRYYEDMAVICQLLDSVSKIAIGNQQKYYYVQRKDSIMSEDFNTKKMHRIEIAEEIRFYINNKYPNLIKAANARCFLAAIQTFREIPLKSEYDQYIDLAWKEIVKYRGGIIIDSDVKIFHKMISLGTYLGKDCLKILGCWFTVVSKRFFKF